MIYTIHYSDTVKLEHKHFDTDDNARQYGRNHHNIKAIYKDGELIYSI
jgi:hypothetical protein